MLYLLSEIEGKTYGFSCDHVLEVVPKLVLRESVWSDPCLLGLMEYKDSHIPVIDFKMVLMNQLSQDVLKTRMLICQASDPSEIFAILAENTIEALQISDDHTRHIHINHKGAEYFDALIEAEERMIQIIDLEKLYDRFITHAR